MFDLILTSSLPAAILSGGRSRHSVWLSRSPIRVVSGRLLRRSPPSDPGLGPELCSLVTRVVGLDVAVALRGDDARVNFQ